MLKRRGRGRKIASDLLTELEIPAKAPVDLDIVMKQLAEKRKLSIEVLYEDFSKDMTGVSAILIKEKGKAVIAVNNRHPEVRQRFSLAHELGHLIMHGNYEHLKVEKSIQPRLFTRADGIHSLDEKEANEFAAELLMPEELIRKDFEKYIDKKEDNIISYLAEKYNVSEIALQYRLNNLDLMEINV
jgi:Zn-dependent peptidase ImmA (M78 family)